ncbi:hypothetical protein B2G69_07785 [Methylorubrum zatmanii]|nr:hypothetical protein [Methylorubrum zatmanii]ARO54055.1 hypothetical protein B2G69_07785 [Methylorubrum zatmanii]
MTRAAAFLALGLLAATPAGAGCQTVPEVIEDMKKTYPATAYVAEIPASLVPTVRAWLESEGMPHRAQRIVQLVCDRGLALILIDGERACDGTPAVMLLGDRARDLVALVQRYRDLKGIGQERAA